MIFHSFRLSKPYVRLLQVLLSIYTIVSLAFGLFHVFGTTRPPGVP